MNASRSNPTVGRGKQALKKLAETATFLQQQTVSAYRSATPDNLIYWVLPILLMLIAFIGLFVAQVANCKFGWPIDHFLFGMKPGERILG
jgi:hypothetical protein